MGEVQEFLLEELEITKKKKEVLEAEMHTMDIQVDFITQAIDKITLNEDTTGLVFMSEQEQQGVDRTGIQKLKQKKKELLEKKNEYLHDISESVQRVTRLEQLLKEDTQESKKSKVYNTYEVIYMQEADRQRIARDIHDTVVQGLTVLIHKNEFVKKIFETDRQRAQLELEKNNTIIRESIDELRNIIFDLRPMSLDDLGFEKTFYAAVEKLKNSTQMVVQTDYLCKTEKIDAVISITVLRILQELCSNSMKYSDGSKIHITVKDDEESNLIILYSDNGHGYDIENPVKNRKNNTGFGLSMLRERIALLHGMMEVCYKDNQLSYTIRIPLSIKKLD